MPFPNSQSPITLRLNEMFSDGGARFLPRLVNELNNRNQTLGEFALTFSIARNAWEKRHIDRWPKDQLDLLRSVLIRVAMEGRAVVFDWQEASYTRIDIIDFGTREPIGVTFRSPMVYPPYSTSPGQMESQDRSVLSRQ